MVSSSLSGYHNNVEEGHPNHGINLMSSCAYLVYLLYLVVGEVELGLVPDLLVLQVLQRVVYLSVILTLAET
jgi:hypothetical protein